MPDPDAVTISQSHHDAQSRAILEGDLGGFAQRMALPHSITTQSGTQTIETYEQMAEAFRTQSAKIASQGVTDFIRIVKRAAFVEPDRIVAEHESHLVRNGTRLLQPYPVRVWLTLIDDTWRETHAAVGILNPASDFGTVTKTSVAPTIPDAPHDRAER